MNGRSARLRLSLAQDIVYFVMEGKVKTQKSVLLPVPFSVLSEMYTENAYIIQDH